MYNKIATIDINIIFAIWLDIKYTHFESVSYPYGSYTDVKLYGMVSKKQNDSAGGTYRYVIFIPSMGNPIKQYGVKEIKALVIQGITFLRQNARDIDGYQLVNAMQNRQGIFLSIHSTAETDISGYVCDCVFDLYTP